MDTDYICSIAIRFGPYEAHGFIRHRPLKLKGILSQLSKQGIEVELFPTEYLNELTVEMKGAIIFRCDIRGLKFDMDIDDEDVVGKRLLEAVSDGWQRIFTPQNINKFLISENRMFDPYQDHFRKSSCIEILFDYSAPSKSKFRNDVFRKKTS